MVNTNDQLALTDSLHNHLKKEVKETVSGQVDRGNWLKKLRQQGRRSKKSENQITKIVKIDQETGRHSNALSN